MLEQEPTNENIAVTTNLRTIADTRRAVNLFGRILRAVREQASEDERQNEQPFPPAAA